jgi:hypothetical protein
MQNQQRTIDHPSSRQAPCHASRSVASACEAVGNGSAVKAGGEFANVWVDIVNVIT